MRWPHWIKCRWLPWGNYVVTNDGGAVQVRYCSVCNKAELRFM